MEAQDCNNGTGGEVIDEEALRGNEKNRSGVVRVEERQQFTEGRQQEHLKN
ncbi:MAG: hypothetical protein ACJ76F_10875 [Bacteroidia bacterium]